MSLKIGIVVAFVLALAVIYFVFMNSREVSASDARQLVADGAHLIDVRTPEEFKEGHLPGATNIPVQEFERRIGEIEPKERPVVVYCRSGTRSGRAAEMLKSAGYTSVHDLGAMSKW